MLRLLRGKFDFGTERLQRDRLHGERRGEPVKQGANRFVENGNSDNDRQGPCNRSGNFSKLLGALLYSYAG